MRSSALRPLSATALIATSLVGYACTTPRSGLPPSEAPIHTAERQAGASATSAAAEAWANDVDEVQRTLSGGAILFAGDAVKQSADKYCAEGTALLRDGDLRPAVRAKSKALYVAREEGDFALAAVCAGGVALAYSFAGNQQRALEWVDEAEGYLKKADLPAAASRSVMSSLQKIRGDANLALGKPEAAESLFRAALADSDPQNRPEILVSLANSQLVAGNTAASLRTLDQVGAHASYLDPLIARVRWSAALGEGNPRAALEIAERSARTAQLAGDDYSLVWAERGIAQAHVSLGRRADAHVAYQRALQAAERLRGKFHTEEFRSGALGNLQDVFDEAIGNAIALNRIDEAFQFSEQSRARTLDDLVRDRAPLARQEAGAGTSTAALARQLPEGVAVVSYHVLPEHTLAWTVRRSGASVAVLDVSRAMLSAETRSFRKSVLTGATAAVEREAGELYSQLIKPANLAAGERIIIVPHGPLHYLPFAALRYGDSWLTEEHPVEMALSDTSLLSTRTADAIDRQRVLAMGNPDLGDPDTRLPGAEVEALAIKTEFPDASVYLREDATRTRFVAQATKMSVVHVAAHASFDRLDPIYSAIFLAGATPMQGRLEAREIYGLNLRNADLVVLSACETGMGEVSHGDEFFGFTRSFVAAGARQLIVTLWPVDDVATQHLMRQFYSTLDREGAANALRRAQLSLIHSRSEYAPVYWAPFVLYATLRAS